VKGSHGLTADLNYTLSKSAGKRQRRGRIRRSLDHALESRSYNLKNLTDQVDSWNHTHEVKGYLVYDYRYGRGKELATGRHAIDEHLLGGGR